MTDLHELLERAGDSIEVGPLPYGRIAAGVRRRAQRRHTFRIALASAAAVVAAVGVVATVPGLGPSDRGDGGDSAASADTAGSAQEGSAEMPKGEVDPQAATRLIGIDHIGVQVPEALHNDTLPCNSGCTLVWSSGSTTVQLSAGTVGSTQPGVPTEHAVELPGAPTGVSAVRTDMSVTMQGRMQDGVAAPDATRWQSALAVTTTSGTVVVDVQSTQSAQAVEEILDSVRWVEDEAGFDD